MKSIKDRYVSQQTHRQSDKIKNARQITQELYNIAELSPKAHKKACDDIRHSEPYNDMLIYDVYIDDYKDYVIDDFPNSKIDEIYFDIEGSQGYPEMFSIVGTIPLDEIMSHIELTDSEKRALDFYDSYYYPNYIILTVDRDSYQDDIECFGANYSSYMHERDEEFSERDDFEELCDALDEIYDGIDEKITDYIKDYDYKMLKQLQDEYEYDMSDEAIEEFCNANDYEFYADGTEYFEH